MAVTQRPLAARGVGATDAIMVTRQLHECHERVGGAGAVDVERVRFLEA
jgi:hypothetical protein